jgi:hypothetical protein
MDAQTRRWFVAMSAGIALFVIGSVDVRWMAFRVFIPTGWRPKTS